MPHRGGSQNFNLYATPDASQVDKSQPVATAGDLLFGGIFRKRSAIPATMGSCYGPIEEDPYMAALPGTGALQCIGHDQLLAGLGECERVILPGLLVEVSTARNQQVSSGKSG
jgi:hypothetical protein